MTRIVAISIIVLFSAVVLEFFYRTYSAFELALFTVLSYIVLKLAFYIERFFR